MKNQNYFVGFDIGTDSVGYAVTDENYELCKFKGEAMWGVTLFDEAQLAADRRSFRAARRRLDRRQQRVRLIMELFATEIAKVDEGFFERIKSSYLYPTEDKNKVRLFETYQKQAEYAKRYPTIHHLITELMNDGSGHDPRLIYIACAWLVAHRGHFLNEVDKQNVDAVTDFGAVYSALVDFIAHDEYALPWREDVDIKAVQEALKVRGGITKRQKMLTEVLFEGKKAPKQINEQYEYNYDLVLKLLCGGKVGLKELFDKEEYSELEEKSIALGMDDDKLANIMLSIGDDSELIRVLKAIYDWSVLVDVLKGKSTISEAKVEVYEQHQRDLALLKRLIKKYSTRDIYNKIFRAEDMKGNYVSYVGGNSTAGKDAKVKKAGKEEFCQFILSIIKHITPDDTDLDDYNDAISRLEAFDFMPKQVDGDNRVIPYQLYWYELNRILENARGYIPFLAEMDKDGITGAQKILSVFEFRVPYYVGPLKEKSDPRYNHWMVRRANGRIYPWNFEQTVDLDASEEAFIARMTNSCTYLPCEDVLPKNSLVYCAFDVLNEINNIKINGNDIPVAVKQSIFNNLFMQTGKVTFKRIRDHLIANNHALDTDIISGIDVTVKSSLKPFIQFNRLVSNGLLTQAEVEEIIGRSTCSEDKRRLAEWLRIKYPQLSDADVKYIVNLKIKDFGRLSRRLLCGIEVVNNKTGEYYPSVLRAMWETNCNLMQIMSDNYTVRKKVDEIVKEYYGLHPKSISARLEEMYVSNSVKRPIIRTLDILKDIVKVQGRAPEKIFIEMARGANENQKGKRTATRLQQILELYKKVRDEDVRHLQKLLDEWGDSANNKLQSNKLFLYFIQLGKCLYTGKPIDIESVIAGDGTYNIEHIYPRSFVKDDSIINNLILVDSKANGSKSDSFPIDPAIQGRMQGYWGLLRSIGLMSDEKYKRLTRNTHFTEEERFEFINRQLVETRQSTKVVSSLLQELYPDTKIVYVKAGLVSDFRQKFDLLKSRSVNDLHHAKDAYLNVVVGNVWHSRFSRQFWRPNDHYSAKIEIVFTHPVICQGRTVWDGAADKDRVVRIVRRNTAHITMYSYCKHSGQNGGFFDQNPLKAKEGLIPLKKEKPTEIYGGYDSATVTGFIMVRYLLGKKTEISFVPLKLLYMKQFVEDKHFAIQYIADELGGKAKDIEILLNGRIIKIYTMLSLDGMRMCIRGKGTSTTIGLMNMMPFITSIEHEQYIKRLEAFDEKRKNNENIVWDERHDGISKEKNNLLYAYYIEKLSCRPYNKRPGATALISKLIKQKDVFKALDVFKQVSILLQIQGLFGRMKQADLKFINESSNSGITTMSLNLSNWKKTYTDVRIIDQSASGLFEAVSENLLELL